MVRRTNQVTVEEAEQFDLEELPCRSNPELWFSESRSDMTQAENICNSVCPKQAECLQQALRLEGGVHANYRHGVWGGMRASKRYTLSRKMRAA